MSQDSGELEVGGRRVRLTNLDKLLFPRAGFRKADLVTYYRGVSRALLAHVSRRPMTLGRFPNGVEARGFAQTECRGPDWIATHELELRGGGRRRYCLLDDEAALVWAANLGTIELHPYPWRAERPEVPDALLLDLDPGEGAGLAGCCRVALIVREELDRLGLAPLVKTTGGGGLHVIAPLEPVHTFEQTKLFARRLAGRLADRHPGLITAASPLASRTGRVLIDWRQNDARRSTVAPYSLRAADHPLASAPVSWDEVAGDPDALWFDAQSVRGRLERHGDLHAAALQQHDRGRLPLGTGG